MIKIACKKPLKVQVMQLTSENEYDVNLWSNGQVRKKDDNIYYVQCLEALAETPVGSYVVMGVKGEVWPVREDIFNETYEVLSE